MATIKIVMPIILLMFTSCAYSDSFTSESFSISQCVNGKTYTLKGKCFVSTNESPKIKMEFQFKGSDKQLDDIINTKDLAKLVDFTKATDIVIENKSFSIIQDKIILRFTLSINHLDENGFKKLERYPVKYTSSFSNSRQKISLDKTESINSLF